MTWLLSHAFSMVGLLLGVLLFGKILRQRRAPASTMSWLLVIVLVPYVGVPLFLVLGGRKARKMAARKRRLYTSSRPVTNEGCPVVERILCSEGAPHALGGNRVDLLSTGETAFHAFLEAIDGAQNSMDIATFILGNDEVGNTVLDRLEKKARSGVQVRLLLDSLFSFRPDRKRLNALERAGGRIAYFMPVIHVPFRGQANLRNHRKIAVGDGKTAIVGGMNLALEYMGPTPRPGRWRDVSMRVGGPAVDEIAHVFDSDWAFASGEVGSTRQRAPARPSEDGTARIQVVASGPDFPGDTFYDAILSGLFEAKTRIWLATPYFIPDEALARALILAVRRGVDVRILVPERSNHLLADLAGGDYLREIQKAGGRICPYKEGMIHAKVTVIDEALGVLGSANMDMRSLFLDYEIALFFQSKDEIALLARWFESVLASCGERLPDASRARALAEDLGRLVGALL